MKTNRLSLVLALALGSTSVAFAQTKTLSGEIMDAPCAEMGSHEHMMKAENAKNAREWTLACSKTHGDLVLYDAANKKVYKLDDHAKAKTFAGQKVTVSGVYGEAVKTIHVRSIRPAVRSRAAAASGRPSRVTYRVLGDPVPTEENGLR